MMILPIADALQNTLQDLVSRIAGVNNDELANRGIGMAGAMAYSIKTIAYQFKGSESQINNNSNQTSLLGRIFNNNETSQITPMKTTPMETNKMNTTPMNSLNTESEQGKENSNNLQKEETSKKNSNITNMGRKAFNTGKEFLNMGMYMAEGRNFDTRRNYNRNNVNDTRKEDFKKKDNENSTIINIQEDDEV